VYSYLCGYIANVAFEKREREKKNNRFDFNWFLRKIQVIKDTEEEIRRKNWILPVFFSMCEPEVDSRCI